jgi:copper chaperone NosL
MSTNKIAGMTKIFLVLSAIALAISIFVPIWRIELDAPQYPEGLSMKIFSYKLAGDVDVINGLNHYIGMATLHTEDFIEFAVLPYLIGLFSLLALLSALIGNRKFFFTLFSLFLLFGIIAMVDFWRWEYNYGHNLDPTAPIQVPGMAYQPPLIGYKQLLNFGAFSVPDIGGWLFIGSGLLMLLGVAFEMKWLQKLRGKTIIYLSPLLLLTLASCDEQGPEPIQINKDLCAFCKMTIVDDRFGAEIITEKGRHYKFDDLQCMVQYDSENKTVPVKAFYIHNYAVPGQLIDASTAYYIEGENVRSPMRGDMAAFSGFEEAQDYGERLSAQLISWNDIYTSGQ